jgi:hypothetical protein
MGYERIFNLTMGTDRTLRLECRQIRFRRIGMDMTLHFELRVRCDVRETKGFGRLVPMPALGSFQGFVENIVTEHRPLSSSQSRASRLRFKSTFSA